MWNVANVPHVPNVPERLPKLPSLNFGRRSRQTFLLDLGRNKTLIYTIKWDDAAFVSKFYEKLKNKIKNAMVAMDRPDSLKNMINIAVKVDDR